MANVYLLSTHDEYGSVNVHATLDATQLPRMLEPFQIFEYPEDPDWSDETKAKIAASRAEVAEETAEMIKNPDKLELRVPHDLQHCWGGIQLHIVPLETDE